jgi:hypothetical protein
MLCWIFIVLAHWKNSAEKYFAPVHSETLSSFRTIQFSFNITKILLKVMLNTVIQPLHTFLVAVKSYYLDCPHYAMKLEVSERMHKFSCTEKTVRKNISLQSTRKHCPHSEPSSFHSCFLMLRTLHRSKCVEWTLYNKGRHTLEIYILSISSYWYS